DAVQVIAVDLGDRLVAPSLRKPARNFRRLAAVCGIVQAENSGGLAPSTWVATSFGYDVFVDEFSRGRSKGVSCFLAGDDVPALLRGQPVDSWIVAKRKLTTHLSCQPTRGCERQVAANDRLAVALLASAVARAERKLG